MVKNKGSYWAPMSEPVLLTELPDSLSLPWPPILELVPLLPPVAVTIPELSIVPSA